MWSTKSFSSFTYRSIKSTAHILLQSFKCLKPGGKCDVSVSRPLSCQCAPGVNHQVAPSPQNLNTYELLFNMNEPFVVRNSNILISYHTFATLCNRLAREVGLPFFPHFVFCLLGYSWIGINHFYSFLMCFNFATDKVISVVFFTFCELTLRLTACWIFYNSLQVQILQLKLLQRR